MRQTRTKNPFSWALGKLFLLLLPSIAFALPSPAPRLLDNEFSLGISGNSYLTSSRGSISDERTGNIGATLAWRGVVQNDTGFTATADIEALYGLRKANYRYLNFTEAFVGDSAWTTPLFFGRKLEVWNDIDDYWSLGLFQPRFRWDYLEEKQNGLTGFFLEYKNPEVFELAAFASPIFIPEQGAPFDITGGDCHTTSPWFNCPSSTVLLFNQPTDVKFNLDIPPIYKLIFHPGAALTMRFGPKKGNGVWGRLSAAYKPINQLLLAYEGRLDLSTGQLPALIHPRELYHELYSGEIGYKSERSRFVAALISERPHRDNPPVLWNTQEVDPSLHVGAIFSTEFWGDGPESTWIDFSFLRREKGNAPDKGPFANVNGSVFEPRFNFSNAFSVIVHGPLVPGWQEHFQSRTQFILDTLANGNIFIHDFFLKPYRGFLLNFGLDILGSSSRSAVDFISRYQRNDRVRGGVSYVF